MSAIEHLAALRGRLPVVSGLPLPALTILTVLSIPAQAARQERPREPSKSLSACVAALQAELRILYPASSTASSEHRCEVSTTLSGVIFECRGACIDRSGHNDACEAYDENLKVTLSKNSSNATAWNRRDPDASHWRVMWTRQYRSIRAEVVTYASAGVKRVANRAIRRLHRTIDGCIHDLEADRRDR